MQVEQKANQSSLTPKAVIYQKFGSNACYKVEEVQDTTQSGCPGLSIPQKGPCLYRCHLQLPEFSVMSETFKRKKDAEQSAAQKAIEKLGIHSKDNLTAEEAWDELVSRLSYLFSSEFLSSVQPLSGHFRAALWREGVLNGFVPVSVISFYDGKFTNLCKYINPEIDSDPRAVISLIKTAAEKLSGSILFSEEHLALKKFSPHPPDVIESLVKHESSLPDSISIGAIRIPSLVVKKAEYVILNVSTKGYYLDVIANELGANGASEVMISRTIGKASSETRLFFCSSRPLSISNIDQASQSERSVNIIASYLSGQEVYGDAILASIGFTWRSTDLFYEDLSLRAYYRLLVNKIPNGIYKLSRDAILAAELPSTFTTRSNWRGSSPRDILGTFCHQHRLSQPIFSTQSNSSGSSADVLGSRKKLRAADSGKDESDGVNLAGPDGLSLESSGAFICEVKIPSKNQELLLHCSPRESYKKQTDAMQNAALIVLKWLDKFFSEPDLPLENLTSYADELAIQFYPQNFFKEFALYPSVFNCLRNIGSPGDLLLNSSCLNKPHNMPKDKVSSSNIDGQEFGDNLSSGFLVCLSYSVFLVTEGKSEKELLESSEEFEFEVGSGAVVAGIESAVTQMSVGQSASFHLELPPQLVILAAAEDSAVALEILLSKTCCLEYSVTLSHVTAPLEDRMEQAFFSPPLAKQRVEYALRHIIESRATSLVDFGCGSGSLLDSLLDYPSSLERMVGVDISSKGLARAAKILHSKLNGNSNKEVLCDSIKSAILFKGSITEFDSRLHGFDIGTCLEVIEHVEEPEACLFGDVVLRTFCPRILIVSTPNYEYNVILQKSSLQNQEDDQDEKNQPQSCKFRNHDHKFEWTREQFNHWASTLAVKHNYDVEFSGVGGVAGVEPGFASQIAVFRRKDDLPTVDQACRYKVIWEWSQDDSEPAV